MPKFEFFKEFEHDLIPDGVAVSGSWTADKDYIIKRIHIQRKDGVSITASTFYFKIAGIVYTHEVVPAAVLGPNIEVTTPLDIPFPKGAKLDYTFKNREGLTVSIMITFETWSP